MKYIIIAGCGKTGRALAEELSQENNVVVIDKSLAALEELPQDFNGKKIVGDVLDIETLEKAGIKEADAVVLVTGNDNLNLVVGKFIKRKYNKLKKIILQVYELNKKKALSEEGLIIINRTYLLVEVFKKCIL